MDLRIRFGHVVDLDDDLVAAAATICALKRDSTCVVPAACGHDLVGIPSVWSELLERVECVGYGPGKVYCRRCQEFAAKRLRSPHGTE